MKIRRLQSAKALGATIRKFYEDAWAKRPIAWSVATANPLADICTALGIRVVYPGNYACICAAQHLSEKYCSIAEGYNYKRELCSYIERFCYILPKGNTMGDPGG